MCIYVYITIFLHKRKDVCVLWVTVTSHHLFLLLITESSKRDGSDGKKLWYNYRHAMCSETTQTSIYRWMLCVSVEFVLQCYRHRLKLLSRLIYISRMTVVTVKYCRGWSYILPAPQIMRVSILRCLIVVTITKRVPVTLKRVTVKPFWVTVTYENKSRCVTKQTRWTCRPFSFCINDIPKHFRKPR